MPWYLDQNLMTKMELVLVLWVVVIWLWARIWNFPPKS